MSAPGTPRPATRAAVTSGGGAGADQPRSDSAVGGPQVRVRGNEHRPLHDIGEGRTRRSERNAGVVDRADRLLGNVIGDDRAGRIDTVLAADVDRRGTRRDDCDVTERRADNELGRL